MTALSPSQSGLHTAGNTNNSNVQNQTTSQQQQQPQHSGTAAGLLLDGDGILTQLFYFFWRMKVNAVASAGGGSVTAGTYTHHTKPLKSDDPGVQAVMDLCIPSTVILEHNFPKFWFAKSGDFDDDDMTANRSSALSSAPLERRTGRDIDSAAVIRAFRVPEGSSTAQIPGAGDIVASYYAEATDEEGRACTRVEFLDGEGVKGLLIRRTRRPDGILQCWVSPSGKSNSVVQVIWSPHVTHVTKRTNRFPLRDTRLPLYDRSVTFEGLAHFSDEVFVAPHVKTQTQLVCDELVRHFRDVHRVVVSRMVLYFKTDTAGRLWFLFGNSLRTADRRQISLSLRGMKPQERIDSENAQSSRMARILIDEAYEVKAAHQAHSKMEEYANAHKKIRQAAKEEPVIRALIGGHAPPYVNLRPRPPTLGPIGDTYYPGPRKASKKDDKNGANHSNNNNNKENEGWDQDDGGDYGGDHLGGGNDNQNAIAAVGSSSTFSPSANNNNINNNYKGRSQAAVSLSRLVSKIKSAAALASPSNNNQHQNNEHGPSSVMLTSSLACVIPPLFGLVGTIGGGSFSMFSTSAPHQQQIPYSPFRPTTLPTNNNNGINTSSPATFRNNNNDSSTPSRNLSGLFTKTNNNNGEETEAKNGNNNNNNNKQNKGRSGAVLWQIVRLAVFTGAVKIVVIRPELREFVKGMMYGLYSHFANENATTKMIENTRKGALKQQARPFRILVPQVYFKALKGSEDDEWWNGLGFSRTRVVKVSEAHLLLPPPPPSAKQQRLSKKKREKQQITGLAAADDEGTVKKTKIIIIQQSQLVADAPSVVPVNIHGDRSSRSPTPSDIVQSTAKQMGSDHDARRRMSNTAASTPSADTLADKQGITSSSSASMNNSVKKHMLASDFSATVGGTTLSSAIAAGGALRARSSSPIQQTQQQRPIENQNGNDDGEQGENGPNEENDDEEEEEVQSPIENEQSDEEEEEDEVVGFTRPVLYSGYKKQAQPAVSNSIAVVQDKPVTSERNGSPATSSPVAPSSLSGSKIFRKSDRVVPIQPDLSNDNNNNDGSILQTNGSASKLNANNDNNNNKRKDDSKNLDKIIRLNEIPINSHPDDVVLEVASLSAPLLHVQSQMEKLMRTRIDLPAAKVRFFYAGHRVIMDRRKARSFANVVKQSWIQLKGKEFK